MYIEPHSHFMCFVNIDYDENYQNVRLFESTLQRDNYFEGLTGNIRFKNNNDWQRVKDNSQIKVYGTHDIYKFVNYCRYRNDNYGKYIYAFVTNVESVGENVCRLTLMVDVMQTWLYSVNFHKTLIERAHIKEYENILPSAFNKSMETEDLEIGTEYDVVHTEFIDLSKSYYLIGSSISLLADGGTMENPKMKGTKGGVFDKCPSIMTYYIVDTETGLTSSMRDIVTALQDYPWIARGIQFLTVIPKDLVKGYQDNVKYTDSELGFKIGYIIPDANTGNGFSHEFKDYLSYFGNINKRCGKMLMFPYSFIEMTAYNGTQLEIKNESVNDTSLNMYTLGYISPTPRMVVGVYDYNGNNDNGLPNTEILPSTISKGDFLDFAITLDKFPQFPIAINNYGLYMAENANSFALTSSLSDLNRTEGRVKAGIGAVGAVANLLTGNIGGAVNSGMDALGKAYSTEKNYYVETQKVLAQQNDAKLKPPSLGGQNGGDGFNIAKGITGITLKWKTIKPVMKDKIENYWIRYGYKLNSFDYPDNYFNLNKELNFIKTIGCTIGGNIPTQDKRIIERIFDNGVTLWHINDIGNYTTNDNV